MVATLPHPATSMSTAAARTPLVKRIIMGSGLVLAGAKYLTARLSARSVAIELQRAGPPVRPGPSMITRSMPGSSGACFVSAQPGNAWRAAAGPARAQARFSAPAGRQQPGQPRGMRHQLVGTVIARDGDDGPDPAARQREPLPRPVRGEAARHRTHSPIFPDRNPRPLRHLSEGHDRDLTDGPRCQAAASRREEIAGGYLPIDVVSIDRYVRAAQATGSRAKSRWIARSPSALSRDAMIMDWSSTR
jgi:hypothetical protein